MLENEGKRRWSAICLEFVYEAFHCHSSILVPRSTILCASRRLRMRTTPELGQGLVVIVIEAQSIT